MTVCDLAVLLRHGSVISAKSRRGKQWHQLGCQFYHVRKAAQLVS